ncbi:transposase [Rubinisphaera italica]|uniref:Transposase n=1 Tax=Rubinisphaera italica TaxID=2527969 RepID=A0A5C5X9J6_9PLAN|nr:transposase [Rubinisphaera italica]TWT59620.1 Transposase [Rubinisphaera italica]
MTKKKTSTVKRGRREYTDEFKEEAVQMLLDGHTAVSVVKRLGISNINVLYRWKKLQLERSGPVASSLEARVQELESELRRVERERDILKDEQQTLIARRVRRIFYVANETPPTQCHISAQSVIFSAPSLHRCVL